MHDCSQSEQLKSITNTDCAGEVSFFYILDMVAFIYLWTIKFHRFSVISCVRPLYLQRSSNYTVFPSGYHIPKQATCTDNSHRMFSYNYGYDGDMMDTSCSWASSTTEVPIIIGKGLLKAVTAFIWQLPRVQSKRFPLAPWLSQQLSWRPKNYSNLCFLKNVSDQSDHLDDTSSPPAPTNSSAINQVERVLP